MSGLIAAAAVVVEQRPAFFGSGNMPWSRFASSSSAAASRRLASAAFGSRTLTTATATSAAPSRHFALAQATPSRPGNCGVFRDSRVAPLTPLTRHGASSWGQPRPLVCAAGTVAEELDDVEADGEDPDTEQLAPAGRLDALKPELTADEIKAQELLTDMRNEFVTMFK